MRRSAPFCCRQMRKPFQSTRRLASRSISCSDSARFASDDTTCSIAWILFNSSAATASAKVKSRVITIGQDFIVAGTTIKAGTYRFSFDDQKHELTVSDRKTKQVLARVDPVRDGPDAPEWIQIARDVVASCR